MGHTPGPWKVCSCGKCFTVGGKDYPICSVEHGEWGDHYPAVRIVDGKPEAYIQYLPYGKIRESVARANAHLIAAAPDLLEAAKAALYLMDQIDALEMERERNQLRSAIEHAEPKESEVE